jgi:ABC-type transport system involved in multi-copper enzyme maturation permease subunit
MIMMLNLGFIGVAALSIFSSAIAEEKEDETLTLLRMTRLSALAILFGKSTSRLFSALLLLAVQIPFTLLAISLGGISLSQVWGAYAILGATTFFLCNLALLSSVYSRTTLRAGFFTGFLGVIFYAVLPVIGIVTSFRTIGPAGVGVSGGTFAQQAWGWIIQANPVWALAMLLGNPAGGSLSMSQIWISLIGGLVCFGLSWFLFDRFCKEAPEVVRRARKKRNGKVRRWGPVGRSWSRLPLAWKDYHFMIGGISGFFLRLAFGVAIFGIVCWGFTESELPHRERYWREAICAVVLGCAAFCAGLELLLLCGRIFGSERQRQTLSSLVGLPWSTGKIIRQKILAASRYFCLGSFSPRSRSRLRGTPLRMSSPENIANGYSDITRTSIGAIICAANARKLPHSATLACRRYS